MPQFLGGPAVRVSANAQVTFEWITDVAWFGEVDVYSNPNGTGGPVTIIGAASAATDQLAGSPIGPAPLSNDTQLYFQIKATDPNDSTSSIYFPPQGSQLLPFFTGAQVLSNVSVQSITTNSATVSWSSNVIGFGKVVYGSTNLSTQDQVNFTDHAIQLTSLSAGTTYQFTASNVDSINGNTLASQSGQFTTAQAPVSTTVVFTEPHAEPRVINSGTVSAVSIRCLSQGNPVPGIVVGFLVDPGSAGAGALSIAQATTDVNGIATVNLTGNARGLVQVKVSAGNATNSPLEIPVVVK